MSRTIRAPRTEVNLLAAEDIVALWRCEEAAAGSNFTDDGANGITLTQTGSPTVGADLVDSASTGARVFDGSTDYASVSSTSYITAMRASWSAWAWIYADTLHAATIIAYGGTGATAGTNNIVASLRITSGGFVEVVWQNGANVNVTTTSTCAYDDRIPCFIGAACEPDPDNAGQMRLRIYSFNSSTRTWSSQMTKDLDPNDTTTSARFTMAVDGTLAAGFFDGRISDAGFAQVALHEWWFREQARHGPQSHYSQEDMIDGAVTSTSYKAVARARIEDSDREWRDLTDLGPTGEDVIKSIEWSRRRDDPRSTGKVTMFRAAGNFNLAIEDRESPWNYDAAGVYAPLIQGRRRARIEYALVPDHDREIEEWEWEGLLEGFIDDPTVSGEEVSFTILDISTPLADMQIVESAQYGDAAGTTVFDTTLQDIIDDNDPASYDYLGGALPDLWFPSATGLTHNLFWASGMSVFEKLGELVEAVGFDCRATYDDTRHEERVAVFEPDRTTASVQWTWGVDDYVFIGDWRQTTSDVRNWCRVYYGDATSKDANKEPVRAYAEYVDTASITKFGPLYCELSEGTGSLVDASAEALSLATLVVQELSDPIAWFNANRPFHPFVELADRIRFEADGTPTMLFSQNTDISAIGVKHTFDASGSRTAVECQGLRASSRGHRINQRFTGAGAASAPVRTPDAPTGLAWAEMVGGGILSWQYPAGRVGRIADIHEVHIGTGSGFTVDTSDPSTTLVGVTRGTVFPIGGYLDADTMPTYAKVIARDRFNNMSAASTGASILAYYVAIIPCFSATRTGGSVANGIGNTAVKVLCDSQEYDPGGDYDAATNYRFTAPRPGVYRFKAQVEFAAGREYTQAFLYLNGALEKQGALVEEAGFAQNITATVEADIYLDITDYVEFYAQNFLTAGGTPTPVAAGTYFQGSLISEF